MIIPAPCTFLDSTEYGTPKTRSSLGGFSAIRFNLAFLGFLVGLVVGFPSLAHSKVSHLYQGFEDPVLEDSPLRDLPGCPVIPSASAPGGSFQSNKFLSKARGSIRQWLETVPKVDAWEAQTNPHERTSSARVLAKAKTRARLSERGLAAKVGEEEPAKASRKGTFCSFCVACESSEKVIITKHMPAKVKRVAAKAARKVPRKPFVSRGCYAPCFRHRSRVRELIYIP